MVELVLPDVRFERSYLASEAELDAHDRKIESSAQFHAYVQRCADNSVGLGLPAGHVPATTLWLVESDELVGRISIRHSLTDSLRMLGGHIGYNVRPSRRRQGHGTRMLALALPHVAALGIDPAMITCNVDNVGSRRIIEANGGVLDEEYTHEGSLERRYWVATSQT